MVGLTTYEIKTKQLYENMRKMFSGVGFFRNEENKYYVKIPKKYVTQFLELNLITEQ